MADKRLNVAVFFSGGGSGLNYLRKHDPNYNTTYKVVACFTDKKTASGLIHFTGVDLLDYTDWRKTNTYPIPIERKDNCFYAPPTLEERRKAYFQEVYDTFLKNKKIDLIILSGFMKKLPKSFVDIFKNRIINIHPSDMRKVNANGEPKYIGDDAVTLAMQDGQTKTLSTIHFVEEKLDCGKIICISKPLPIENRTPQEQQELMKTKCDGPALQNAMRLITLPENSEFRVKIGA